MRRLTISCACLLALTACDNGETECTIGLAEGCDDGLVCERFPDGTGQCTSPVYVEGRVFDLVDDAPVGDARIVARDANGGARSDVTFSAPDGTYSLQVSVPRDADGNPLDDQITLRVDAAGYQTFPYPPREALPIDLGGAVASEGDYTVANATTDVGLIPIEATGSTIEGSVAHAEPAAVLVVAEQGGAAVATSITGYDGTFTLYDVPPGPTTVTGYRAGLYAGPAQVESVSGGVEGVVLEATSEGLASVSGSVNIVNAPGGLTTSVILVLESTFDDVAVRGETPAGLRAAPVSAGFTIEGVPPGRYAVLAAFENDQLVRDPDEGISGTDVVFIDVTAADLDIAESFKVTEALAVVSPGADGLEVVSTVPELVFEQDSSEDGYHLRVYDALGELIHEDLTLGPGSGSQPIRYDLAGAGVSLTPGMIYQFRAWSHGRGSRISATEDLRGVFQYAP